MTMVEFKKLKRSVSKNINLAILNQTVHILHNITVINILFSLCDWCKIGFACHM